MNNRERQIKKKNKLPKTDLSKTENSLPLPNDVMQTLFVFFTPQELLRVNRVCKNFLKNVNDSYKARLSSAQKKQVENGEASAQLKLFNITREDIPLINFILVNKGFLTKEDKAFVKAIINDEHLSYRSLRNEKAHRNNELEYVVQPINGISSIYAGHERDFVRTKLFSYSYQNRFIFCREFVGIPAVQAYLFKNAQDICDHAGYVYRYYASKNNHDYIFLKDGMQIGPALNLETLLLCCLLSEVIQAKEGDEQCAQFINHSMGAVARYGRSILNIERVTNPQQLYALCRLFVEQNRMSCWSKDNYNNEIDSQLLSRFYDCYIEYLLSQKNIDSELISKLMKEKIESLQSTAYAMKVKSFGG